MMGRSQGDHTEEAASSVCSLVGRSRVLLTYQNVPDFWSVQSK